MFIQNRRKPAKIRPNERVYAFCVFFPVCRQKHKIDGKTAAYKINPLKIKKQTCSRPLLAHVAGLLFCAYTPHLHASGIFSGMSWTLTIKRIAFIFIFSKGVLSFIFAFSSVVSVRFSKNRSLFRFLGLAFLLAVQLLRCDLHRRRAQLAKHAKPCFVCVLVYDIFPPCFQLPQVCPAPQTAQSICF